MLDEQVASGNTVYSRAAPRTQSKSTLLEKALTSSQVAFLRISYMWIHRYGNVALSWGRSRLDYISPWRRILPTLLRLKRCNFSRKYSTLRSKCVKVCRNHCYGWIWQILMLVLWGDYGIHWNSKSRRIEDNNILEGEREGGGRTIYEQYFGFINFYCRTWWSRLCLKLRSEFTMKMTESPTTRNRMNDGTMLLKNWRTTSTAPSMIAWNPRRQKDILPTTKQSEHPQQQHPKRIRRNDQEINAKER